MQIINLKKDLKNKELEENLFRSNKKELKPKKWLKIISYFFILILISITFFTAQTSSNQNNIILWFNKLPIINNIKNLAESSDKYLKGEDRNRINILLLGIGGKGHDGGLLTDTIIVASLNPSLKKAALISIPRDLTVPIEGMGWRKINNVHAYAEMKEPGSGGIAASQAVSDILDIPIDYYLTIDFKGFIKVIDELGGIEIEVENTFDDYSYPIMGKENAEPYSARFEHLHIEKGLQTMDGSLALKYARSRHAYGPEGSDFARARRQQLVIQAVKNKLLSLNTFLNPKKIINIIEVTKEHTATNLQFWEIIKLWNTFKNIQKEDITTKVLDNSQNGLLMNARGDDGAYLLVPRSGDFTEIQYYVKNIFTEVPLEEKNRIIKEKTSLEVRNGTWINGLAAKIATDLEKYGFDVIRIANADKQNYQKTVIYDLSYGEKSESLKIIKSKIDANVSQELPEWLIEEISQNVKISNYAKPDFIIILGQNADNTNSGLENSIK